MYDERQNNSVSLKGGQKWEARHEGEGEEVKEK